LVRPPAEAARRRTFLPAAGFLLLALWSCSHTQGKGSPVAGERGGPVGRTAVVVRAAWLEAPLPDARVGLLRSVGGTAVALGRTDKEGRAAFDLPPGRYFLVAEWRRDSDYARLIAAGDRYAYFGGNPVYVDRGAPKEIFLGLEEFPEPPATVGEPAGGTGAAGQVLSGGAPVEGASVFAYVRTESAFRDLGFAASAPTGTDGSFVIDLPPGDYYLLARKRAGGGIAGPMRKGDLFGYYPGNPVSVRPGGYRLLSIPATALKLRNVPSYSGKYKGAALLEGRIVGPDGMPRAGVYAALYDNPDLLNRPVFLSDVTGPDGRFRLPVPLPGVYYLGARSGYGGAPGPGDLYGRFEGNAAHSVSFREGDHLTGVVITVNEVW
jgi:hypothetical protein